MTSRLLQGAALGEPRHSMSITTDTANHSGGAPPTERVTPAAHNPHRRISRLLILPGVALLLLLVIFPVVVEIYISLTTWTPTSGNQWYEAYKDWAWFANFWDGLTSPSFISAVVRTILITAAATGVEFVLGFGLALLFLDNFLGRQVLTVLFLIPMMIVPAVSGFVFYLLLQTNGPVNTILSAILPGTVQPQWLNDPSLTPISVVIVDVWQWTPLMFLILLAGLMAVPEDQIQAADILGASWAQKLRHVVLPIVKPIILIALIIRAMEAFKIFDAAWLLTSGGPGEASSTISVKLYREAFQNSQWGYAAALAIVVMIFVSIAASQAIKPLERRQEGAAS
jgi:multiple sugar transport system permease protein